MFPDETETARGVSQMWRWRLRGIGRSMRAVTDCISVSQFFTALNSVCAQLS